MKKYSLGEQGTGLNYPSTPNKRFGCISSVTFYSDVPLLDLSSVTTRLAGRSTEEPSGICEEMIKYESVSINIGNDPTSRKNGLASFVISHWAETRFSENKYFSEVPLPTDTHRETLEQYERNVRACRKLVN